MKPNEQTAAICGLFCGICPSYPDNCHGCLSSKLTAHCVDCPNGFRDCAKKHSVTRCFECNEFPCKRLDDFTHTHYENGIGHHVAAISDLQYMKDHSVVAWVEKRTNECTCAKCGELIYWMDHGRHICK